MPYIRFTYNENFPKIIKQLTGSSIRTFFEKYKFDNVRNIQLEIHKNNALFLYELDDDDLELKITGPLIIQSTFQPEKEVIFDVWNNFDYGSIRAKAYVPYYVCLSIQH